MIPQATLIQKYKRKYGFHTFSIEDSSRFLFYGRYLAANSIATKAAPFAGMDLIKQGVNPLQKPKNKNRSVRYDRDYFLFNIRQMMDDDIAVDVYLLALLVDIFFGNTLGQFCMDDQEYLMRDWNIDRKLDA